MHPPKQLLRPRQRPRKLEFSYVKWHFYGETGSFCGFGTFTRRQKRFSRIIFKSCTCIGLTGRGLPQLLRKIFFINECIKQAPRVWSPKAHRRVQRSCARGITQGAQSPVDHEHRARCTWVLLGGDRFESSIGRIGWGGTSNRWATHDAMPRACSCG